MNAQEMNAPGMNEPSSYERRAMGVGPEVLGAGGSMMPPLAVRLDNSTVIALNRRAMRILTLLVLVSILLTALIMAVAPLMLAIAPVREVSDLAFRLSMAGMMLIVAIGPALQVITYIRALEAQQRDALFGRGPVDGSPFLVLDADAIRIAHTHGILAAYPYSSVVLATEPVLRSRPEVLQVRMIGATLRVPATALSEPIPRILQGDAGFRAQQLAR